MIWICPLDMSFNTNGNFLNPMADAGVRMSKAKIKTLQDLRQEALALRLHGGTQLRSCVPMGQRMQQFFDSCPDWFSSIPEFEEDAASPEVTKRNKAKLREHFGKMKEGVHAAEEEQVKMLDSLSV